jgi:hypothetical protein
MPKFKSQLASQVSAEDANNLIANYVTARGFKPKKNKRWGDYWVKGVYWCQYVRHEQTQGTINIEVWNFCPAPGIGSLLTYMFGTAQLKVLLKELEGLLTEKSSAETVVAPT